MTEVELLQQISAQLQDLILLAFVGVIVGMVRLGALAFIAGNQR